MKTRNLSILLASLFVIAGASFALSARAAGEVPAPLAIGSTIEDFTLPDVDNKDRSLKSLAGKNGTVLLFIAVQCPVSNAYNERMEKLAADYKAKGIAVIGRLMLQSTNSRSRSSRIRATRLPIDSAPA